MTDENDTVVGYDDKRISGIYEALSGMHVQLDADPLAYGPKRLNAKIAEARKMLSSCEQTFLQVQKDLHFIKRRRRALEVEYDIKMSDLFANDPNVRAGRNVSDREALAKTRLEVEIRELARLAGLIEDLDVLMTVIKAKRTDLKDAQGRLRDQMRVCQEETGLGARWGSKVPDAPTLVPGIGQQQVAQAMDMADVLKGVEGEVNLAKAEGRFPAPEPTPDPDKEALKALAQKPDPLPPEDPMAVVEAFAPGDQPPVSTLATPVPAPLAEPVFDESLMFGVVDGPAPEKLVQFPGPEPEKVHAVPEPIVVPGPVPEEVVQAAREFSQGTEPEPVLVTAQTATEQGAVRVQDDFPLKETATPSEVDAFLDMGLDAPAPAPVSTTPASPLSGGDVDLDSILDAFGDKGIGAPK